MRPTLCFASLMVLFSPVARSESLSPSADRPAPGDEKKPRDAEPSEAFRAFVANVVIKAARADGRVIIDRGIEVRLFRIGDVVDARVGIKLYSVTVDSGVGTVVFQEMTGALLARKVDQKGEESPSRQSQRSPSVRFRS